MTLKFDEWPRKTIGHFFYTTSSFVHHFKSIDEFKLELQSRNAQIRVKIGNFVCCVTLKFDGWPWKTIEHLSYAASSFVHHFKSIDEFKAEVTVQKHSIQVNNRAPLLCCFKLCVSFQSHGWIQTGVTVRKHSIRVKIGNFLSHVISKFDRWPWKTVGHLSYAASSFVHHLIAIGEFKLELQSGTAQFGSKWQFF